MRGSADTARIHDATRRLSFSSDPSKIVRQDQKLEMKLESTSNFTPFQGTCVQFACPACSA